MALFDRLRVFQLREALTSLAPLARYGIRPLAVLREAAVRYENGTLEATQECAEAILGTIGVSRRVGTDWNAILALLMELLPVLIQLFMLFA